MCAPKTLMPICDNASGSVPATPADAADASTDLGVEADQDDGTDEECDAIGSVIAQFGVRMSAKSGKGRSAGVKAAQSKNPSKATGGGLPKQPKPSPTKRSNAGTAAVDSAKVSASMEESDIVSLDDFSAQVHGHTHNMFAHCADSTDAVCDVLKKAMADLTTLTKLMRDKIKSVGRRKSNEIPLIKVELEKLVTSIDDMLALTRNLQACNGTDEDVVETLEHLNSAESSWVVADAIFKRAFKCKALTHLRFGDWDTITSSYRDSILNRFGESDGSTFFAMMLNEIVQKMLRGIPLAKALVAHHTHIC
jgi:hypothetical protein